VVDYCHAHNQYELTASEAKASVLFYNKAIDRMRRANVALATGLGHREQQSLDLPSFCAGRVSDELLAAIFKALEDRGAWMGCSKALATRPWRGP
jgi:hypothetical protein